LVKRGAVQSGSFLLLAFSAILAEALGEPPKDPLSLFSVLYGSWAANLVAFKGDVLHELADQFLALAKSREGASVPIMVGHFVMGTSLLLTGEITLGRAHLDQATTLYDPAAHRSLATRFGADIRVASLFRRSMALWLLGYPANCWLRFTGGSLKGSTRAT
jgi:hypothetical protein